MPPCDQVNDAHHVLRFGDRGRGAVEAFEMQAGSGGVKPARQISARAPIGEIYSANAAMLGAASRWAIELA
jgi:hypothetical protein